MLPEPPVLGPAARSAGMSPTDLLGWQARLLAAADLWIGQAVRFRNLGVTPPLGGPCGRALLAAHAVLMTELAAVAAALETQAAELRTGAAA
ncbi:MAG: hypothetical protein M3P23_14535 [Actinomycetota bacterium]|nr:hypothetical protein [Actinomycetota bacterium]